jgi:predicted  nucleic acid-binding Zn-ribbon protein
MYDHKKLEADYAELQNRYSKLEEDYEKLRRKAFGLEQTVKNLKEKEAKHYERIGWSGSNLINQRGRKVKNG